MALTQQQKTQLLEYKSQGLSKEQAFARVFRQPETQQEQGRFADIGQDLKDIVTNPYQAAVRGKENIVNSLQAGARGEQTPIETGLQIAGNAVGAASDAVFGTALKVPKLITSQKEEEAIGQKVAETVSPAVEKYDTLSPRTKRNIGGAFGLFEGISEAVGGGVVSRLFKGASKADNAVASFNDVVNATEQKLKKTATDTNLTPLQQEEAARSALTFRERAIGLQPDQKKRLEEMGPEKLQEYLDAVHLRNIDDTKPTPYEIGSQNVNDALEKLQSELNNTGSGIGQTRTKLASVRVPIDPVRRIEKSFTDELDKLNLTIKNGSITQKPGTISKTASTGDVRMLQKLYNDMQTFKQAPSLANAIDLRMAFDGTVNFGKSAREVSNSVDPLSRSVRKSIAQEAARVVGKTNAKELEKYTNFMEAYGDLRSYTDRAAGGEYLLRLVLSGRGGESRQLIDTIKEYTGVDLMNDATAMRIVTERFGNEATKNLFRQEVSNAGFDVAALLSGEPLSIAQAGLKRLAKYGIDEETVLKATAAGTGGILLMAYSDQDGLVLPAGLAVMSAMPSSARKEAYEQASKMGRKLHLSEEMKGETLNALMKADSKTVMNKKGQVDIEGFDEIDRFKDLAEKPKGLTDQEFIEVRALLEQFDAI